MSAVQQSGGDWFGFFSTDSLRLRHPPAFYCLAESEPPFPTKPPGFLTMSDDDLEEAPRTETRPPSASDEAVALAAQPNAFPPTERPTRPETLLPVARSSLPAASQGDSYFAAASRDFARAIDEMKLTRKEIADGFKNQGADLALIRHELAGFGMRLTGLEGGQRDMRAELRQVKDDLRGALERIEELERRYDSAPPAASSE